MATNLIHMTKVQAGDACQHHVILECEPPIGTSIQIRCYPSKEIQEKLLAGETLTAWAWTLYEGSEEKVMKMHWEFRDFKWTGTESEIIGTGPVEGVVTDLEEDPD